MVSFNQQILNRFKNPPPLRISTLQIFYRILWIFYESGVEMTNFDTYCIVLSQKILSNLENNTSYYIKYRKIINDFPSDFYDNVKPEIVDFKSIYNWKILSKNNPLLENLDFKYKFSVTDDEKVDCLLLRFAMIYQIQERQKNFLNLKEQVKFSFKIQHDYSKVDTDSVVKFNILN